MKPQYYKLPKHHHELIIVREDITSKFYGEWHYHDKIEMVYIIKGTGTRFIGDNISRFSDGDLLLVGEYLPHVWKNDALDSAKNDKKRVHAIIVQFPGNIGGDEFLGISELSSIKKLLGDSRLGINFSVLENHIVKKQLKKMVSQSPFDRLLSLLSILKKLSEIKEKIILSSIPFADYYKKHKSKRIDKIYEYVTNNYKEEIKLEDLASIANMTPTSLCRFFKHSTRKSISEFINEVRIGYSCKLLFNEKLTISDVCFSCGYNNLSYFNRQFKKHIGISPSAYQKQISDIEK
ncbi:MAG: AraC family transcriptional regulator [Bacteroidota bacterium]